MERKRLYRSKTERSVAGVCGGLAEYFQVDVALVRLAFVLLTIAGGPGLIIYFVLAIVIPAESTDSVIEKRKHEEY